MPFPMPDPIKKFLLTNMPPTHKMWWMRSVLMGIEPKQVSQGGPSSRHYFRLGVLDIDAKKEDRQAYTIDVSGAAFKDHRPKDRVSLLGHEPINATHLSIPRFFYHHETLTFGPCFDTHFIDRNYFPVVDLIATVEGSARDKEINSKSRWGALVGMTREDIAGRFKGGGVDLTEIYRMVSGAVNLYVEVNPDAKFPCENPRPENQHQGGALVD